MSGLTTRKNAIVEITNRAPKVCETVQTGAPLDAANADIVASAMKDWAIAKGVKFF